MSQNLRMILAAAVLWAAFGAASPAQAAPNASATAGPAALSTEEFGLIRAVNVMRKARGLPMLTLRQDLSQAARAYAKRMADKDFFSHVAPEGDGPTDRADAVGYDWMRLGETLAAGYRTPADAVRSWRDSPGHAKIIFDPKHRHIGVGFWRRRSSDAKRPRLERYWVLLAGDTR